MPSETDAEFLREAELFRKAEAELREKPEDIKSLQFLCFTYEKRFGEKIEEILVKRLAGHSSLQTRADELFLLAYVRERLGRRRLGLSCSNAEGIDDLGFRFAAAEIADLREVMIALLQKNPKFRLAGATLADALVGEGNIPHAEWILSQLRATPKKDLASVTSFDPIFHDTLGDVLNQAVAHRFPSMCWLRAFDCPPRHCVFVSSDYRYFQQYGEDLVASFRANASGAALALHVMDMTEDEGVQLRSRLMHLDFPWALSTEWTGLRASETSDLAREHYHAVRFVRFWQTLEKYPQVNAWLLDMDTIFNRPVDSLMGVLQAADAGLFLQPARIQIRNKIMAQTGISSRPLGRDFLRRVAGYISAYSVENRLVWGIDQVALYAVLTVLRAKEPAIAIAAMPAEVFDGSYQPDRIMWPAKCVPSSPDYNRVMQRCTRFRKDMQFQILP